MEIMHAFSKGIKTTQVEHQVISDFGIIGKITEIIGKLESLPGTEQLNYSELKLKPNIKDWIDSLIADHSTELDERPMRYLLSDFTSSMNTRSREDKKNVVGILFGKRIIICHSLCGSETITPAWDIITRMLDTDNVIRFVSFDAGEKFTTVHFWEKLASRFLIDWLGLARKRGFAYGGAYRLQSEMEEMTVELQLDDTQIDKFLESHPEFKNGKIILTSAINQLSVESVKIAGSPSYSVEDFLQLHAAEKFGTQPYRDQYEEINHGILPVLFKYIDEEKEVVRISEGTKQILVKKDLPDVELLFVNEYVDISHTYLNKLITRILNNEPLKIFHVGCELNEAPIKIGKTEFYSKLLIDDLTHFLIDFYNSTKLADVDLDHIFKY